MQLQRAPQVTQRVRAGGMRPIGAHHGLKVVQGCCATAATVCGGGGGDSGSAVGSVG